ncbi:TonB family protein [Asaia spathodeae]|uniref:energy transducer TonB n=1 Tax=Asaia spathodeae TaxID=657016 RepID=UPI002FC362D2
MNYAEQERRPTKYIVGIAIAVLFHVVVIYALVNGLGSKIVEQFHPPIKTKIITEPKKPPPPPPPPPPQMTTPPPPYIPPPKIQIQPPPQKRVIKQVTHEKPPAPMPPATVSAPPTPSAPVGPPVPDHSAGAVPINGAKPVFPEEMLEENREGSVTVACDIDTTGKPSNCQVLNSSGGHAFVEAAMEFLRKARYQPAVTNGQAVVEHHHTLHINFALGDD